MPVNVDVGLTDYGGGIFSIHGNSGKGVCLLERYLTDVHGTVPHRGTGESL